MSTNGVNVCEDAEMADCDGDKVVTMMDVLKEQEDFEEDANAVLGASDDKNCTYSKGYIKRQAIYACMTCTDARSDPTKRAGVCLACSLTCHENHELIELYTKRNFRCDCGNPKFNSHPCQFTPDKTDLNIENVYNQNFSGVYCTCHRPYPDPESNIEGDMIQCIVCEDWLHCSHLDAVVPPNEQYSEMICKACMDKNEFLHDYSDLAVNKENMDVDIMNTSSENISLSNCNEESTTEQATDEHKANSNSDETVNAQTESNNVEKANDEDETKKAEDSTSISELTEEINSRMEEESNNIMESDTPPSESIENNPSESNVSKSETNEETEIEQENEPQPEETKTSADTTNDNPIDNKDSLVEAEAAPKNVVEIPDNRSQEQVEEDLLLADPVETDSNQKEVIANVTSSSAAIQSSTEAVTNETKSRPEVMDTSESVNEDQVEKTEDKEDSVDNESKSNGVSSTEQLSEATAEESENVASDSESQSGICSEQTVNDTSVEQKEVAPNTELKDEDTTKVSESKQIENSAITENSEGVPVADKSETIASSADLSGIEAPSADQSEIEAPSADQSEIEAPSADQSEIEAPSADQSEIEAPSEQKESVPENVLTDEQIDQQDKNDNNEDVSENKSSTVREENESVTQENATDIVMEENNTDKAVSNDIQNDESVNNSTCNDNKTIETDVLKRKFSDDVDTENVDVKKQKLESNNCVRPKGVKKVHCGATFWPSNFRHKLCTCNECISMYKDLSVLFLIDPDDTVTAYERLGKEKTDGKPASQYEKGMAALSSLGRVQQINALTEYAKLRDKLLDFLKTFKDKKVIVKEEDIKAFFAGMKPVREPDGVYFCR